jgi:hypothetical protein
MLNELLKPILTERWPDRAGLVIPPGRYFVTETLVLDFLDLVDGNGVYYDSRGKGPFILAPGVTIVPAPTVDWTGKAVVEICGSSSHPTGLRVDSRALPKPPAVGILLGGVKKRDGSGFSYHGGNSTFLNVECMGLYTEACVGLVNGEMVTFIGCDLNNEYQGGSGLLIARGTSAPITPASRITLEGFTQTQVTFRNGRIRTSGNGSAVRGENYIGQITITENIITTDSGPVFTHTGSQAKHVCLIRNRWESWHGSYLSYFEKAPSNSSIEYNWLTRHGLLQPKFVCAVCPEDIKAANIRFVGNEAWKGLVNTRKQVPTEAAT